jgi:hypothetical protein
MSAMKQIAAERQAALPPRGCAERGRLDQGL